MQFLRLTARKTLLDHRAGTMYYMQHDTVYASLIDTRPGHQDYATGVNLVVYSSSNARTWTETNKNMVRHTTAV